MSAEVWLTVTGEQTGPDGSRDRSRTSCRAVYDQFEGRHIFTYSERDPENGAVTESVMELSESSCSIRRRGAVSTNMRFVPCKEQDCMYETPYGSIPLTTFTRKIAVRRMGENLHARIRYRMGLMGADPVECAVTVKAEPLT